MNKDDIIRMAREAGLSNDFGNLGYPYFPELERFAALVAAAEREACAKVCENGTFLHEFSPEAVYSRACAKAIRARGQ